MGDSRKLQVVIDSDTKKAEQGLSSFGGSLGMIGNIAAGIGLANVTGQIIEMGKAAFMTGLDTAAFYETARSGFTTLLGDAKKASQVVEQIKKDAATTPFDAASLVTANKLLLSTGMSAVDARRDIENLGKAVVATGGGSDELSRMAVNLQQIKNVGKATALDIKQFAFAGINIYQLLADATGKNVSEVKDMEVSYDLLSSALAKASGEGGKFANAYKDAGSNFSLLKSNFQDTLGNIFGDIVVDTGAFDAIKVGLLGITTFLTEHKEEITGFFKGLGEGLGAFGQFIVTTFGPLLPILQLLWGQIQTQLVPAFQQLIVALQPIISFIVPILIQIFGLLMQVFIAVTVSIIKSATDMAQRIVAMGTIIADAISVLSEWWSTTWTTMKINAIVIFESIKNGIETGINYVKSVIQSVLTLVGNIFREKLDAMWSTIQGWKDKIVGAFNMVKDAIQGAISAFNSAVSKGVSGFGGGRATGGFASGMTLVGENGPELVNLPTGSYVNRAVDSKRMMGGGGDINVNFNNVSVRNDSDLQTIIETVESVLGRKNELAIMGAL